MGDNKLQFLVCYAEQIENVVNVIITPTKSSVSVVAVDENKKQYADVCVAIEHDQVVLYVFDGQQIENKEKPTVIKLSPPSSKR